MEWFYWLTHEAAQVQRDIYLSLSDRINAFATSGDWGVLAAYLPFGILFGAVHAMTPGHSKIVLATYLTGRAVAMGPALLITWVLSVTHVGLSVVIVVLGLPLVSAALVEVGAAPLMEDISRGLLGAIGLWMLWQGIRRPSDHTHDTEQGIAAGIFAGLIPCPLTFFVMVFATSRGVPEAGLAFAVVMLIGVALTLSTVAAGAVLLRGALMLGFAERTRLIAGVTQGLQIAAGLLLVGIAVNELFFGG